MKLDITKPLVCRDGKEVLWVHEVAGGRLLYGYERDDGVVSYVAVHAEGHLHGHCKSPRDLIPKVEWEYCALSRLEWLPQRESEYHISSWSHINISTWIRRPKGSTDITEWEIVGE